MVSMFRKQVLPAIIGIGLAAVVFALLVAAGVL